MSSDARWYIEQLSGPQREYTDLLLKMCQKYHICWSEASPLEQRFIEEITRYTFESNLAKRGLIDPSTVRPADELTNP